MTFSTYDVAFQAYSDLFKDLNGFRPRGVLADLTIEQLDARVSEMCVELRTRLDDELEEADPDSWKKYAHMGRA